MECNQNATGGTIILRLTPLFGLALGLVSSGCAASGADLVPADAPGTTAAITSPAVADPEYLNITYYIGGKPVHLVDGVAEDEAAPGSASRVVTRFSGKILETNLTGAGHDDVVLILTQETGGSGTFFYLVAAIRTTSGYVGSNGYFLGDRIVMQSVAPGPGRSVIVRYLDHPAREPMAEPPMREVSRQLIFDMATMSFVERR